MDVVPEDGIQKKKKKKMRKGEKRKAENVCIPAVSGISLLNRFQHFRN